MFRLFPQNSNLPFMQGRKLAVLVSFVACALSVWFLATKGLNFGVDFAGGVQIVLEFDEEAEVDAEALRASLGELGIQASVQSFGSELGELTKSAEQLKKPEFIVHFSGEFLEEAVVREKIESALQEEFGQKQTAYVARLRFAGMEKVYLNLSDGLEGDRLEAVFSNVDLNPLEVIASSSFGPADANEYQIQFRDPSSRIKSFIDERFAVAGKDEVVTIQKVDFVGAKVGSDLKYDALLSVIVTILLIFLYIYFQFDLIFAPGVVVALAHDVLITVGVFSLMGMEFDLTTIAALLTVAGYSINDTIIVYDRIREARVEYRGKPLIQIMNLAINQTLSRTVITSFTTLAATAVLFLFGGPVIHSFAFALTVGVFVGTYSSIFVASPLVLFTHGWLGDRMKTSKKQAA